MIQKIRYKKEWFNPLYFELRKYESDPTVRFIFVYGGKGSAKTVSIVQLIAGQTLSKRKNTIAFRKESTLIRTTLKKSFSLAIDTMRLNHGFMPYDLSFKSTTGAEIILKGLDKEEKAKGIESYDYLYFDELNQFTKEEFDQANLSLRGRKGQKIFASWNPVSESSWVKVDFLDKRQFVNVDHTLPCKDSFVQRSTDGKVILIKTTYEDNYWIYGSPCGTYGYKDENLIAEYESLAITNPRSYKVNVKGEWGVEDPEKLFIRNMNRLVHVSEVDYNPSEDTYLAWDLNYDPTCLIIQKTPNGINILKEYRENGITLPYVCAQIDKDYPGAFFFVNGDASGHFSKHLDNSTSYQMIQECLQLSINQFNVPKSNPTHRRSRIHCNAMFDFKEVRIHPSCTGLIKDIESALVDDAGSLDPWKKANPSLSHYIDPLRYHIHSEHYGLIKELNLHEVK